MAFIEGTERNQSFLADFFSIDSFIAEDNYTRVIDAFVDSLNLKEVGFVTFSGDSPGQKPYRTELLLKIHIYCFFNAIPSSRKQERECARNVELIWLTGNLKPDHSTLADFCKINSDALKGVFKQFSLVCRKLDLFDFKLFAFDGTKVKACNSNKRAFSKEKLRLALLHIDEKIDEYLAKIDSASSEGVDNSSLAEFQHKLELVKKRKVFYSEIMDKMETDNLSEYCITDPDAKIMKNHSNIEPCYNVQSVVDSKHKLVADFDVSNQANDVGLLKPMADKLATDFEFDKIIQDDPNHVFTNLADAGYFKTSDVLSLNDDNHKTIVPKSAASNSTGNSNFSKDKFVYNSNDDVYICPANQVLRFARPSKESRNGFTNFYKIYTCDACMACPFSSDCTSSVTGRSIKRNVNEDKILDISNEFSHDSKLYRLRKSLVEHPFGTIKFNMGFTHVFVKGLPRVKSWASSVFLVYNLKRVINIIGVHKLMEVFTS